MPRAFPGVAQLASRSWPKIRPEECADSQIRRGALRTRPLATRDLRGPTLALCFEGHRPQSSFQRSFDIITLENGVQKTDAAEYSEAQENCRE